LPVKGKMLVESKPLICVVTHTFLPHVGGIERVVYEQSKRLAHKFNLLVLTSRERIERTYFFDGIKVECYDSFNFGFRLGIPYAIPKANALGVFLRTIRSSNMIHAHGHPYISSYIAAKLAKKYGKPLVLTQHNTFIDYKDAWNYLETLNDMVVGKANIKLADKIIVVSKATLKYVVNLGAEPEKVEVIHNGVDVEKFRPDDERRAKTREKLQIPQDACVALTVRRLVYKNGIDTLIESARKVVREKSNFLFLVVGTGPDQAEVGSRVKAYGMERNFRLLGFVHDEDLPSYYNAADLFVLPSKSGEGLPLVTLEAMACGLPIIATDVGGIREIVYRDYGRLVPPDNPQLLADEILTVSRMKLAKARHELHALMKQKHSWEANTAKLIKIYEELI
jgi:glycosyltransferase involved in cell wall biosynthesis